MDLLFWAQSKLHDVAALLGFIAVVNVSFLPPAVTPAGNFYQVELTLDDAVSPDIEELLDNSVRLGIVYTITVYTKDNRRVRSEIVKEAVYNSLHERYELRSYGRGKYAEPDEDKLAVTQAGAGTFLQTVSFRVRRSSSYSCVAEAGLKIFSFDDPKLEEQLWSSRTPGITFYFSAEQ
jgi:hypothetical protein